LREPFFGELFGLATKEIVPSGPLGFLGWNSPLLSAALIRHSPPGGRGIQRHGKPLLRGLILLLLASIATNGSAEAPAAAVSGFDAYVNKLESRLAEQHRSPSSFLASVGSDSQVDARLRRGDLIIEQLTPSGEASLPGGLLHHWRGTAFIPRATAADFARLMKDLSAYPQRFAPQVLKAQVDSPQTRSVPDRVPDHFTASMRVEQKHVITVVMDTTYDIAYGRLDAQNGYSMSRSTKIAEIASPGTKDEHALTGTEEHGFLWRLNSYWTFKERDGGLYVQIESVSLTRSIPAALNWIIGPYVKSVPRESVEFTLRSVCNALRN